MARIRTIKPEFFTSDDICALPALARLLAPGGELALAGILVSQREELIQTYAPHFAMSVYGEQDGWVCLQGIRR